MQSELLNELLNTMDTKIFSLVLQLIVVGAVVMWIKDLNGRIVNYYKLKMGDFGRGVKIVIDGVEGYIHHIGFNEVEVIVDENSTLLIPVDKFMKSSKIIVTKRN